MDKIQKPVIGKDVIESLTLGMYEDSRFIFREYVQNSADQIDKAIQQEILTKEDAGIFINIIPDKKTIIIEDNATGVSEKAVVDLLRNIAQSTKIRGVDKGFRGIGRLGGLAYCKKLIFETTYIGEDKKCRFVWDADLLKTILNNRHNKEDASSVISEVTSYSFEKEDSDKHYFRVILEDVTNENLLDYSGVREYLSMVAPVPFSDSFIYKSLIRDDLKSVGLSIDEYKIFLNTEQVFKAYKTTIYKGESQFDKVIDLKFIKEFDEDGKLLYWGWYSISTKNHAMEKGNYARGFRLRKSNIQIGDEYTLIKLHRDRRFQFYFFGEIHAVSADLIPNARRDYFVENIAYNLFEKKLMSFLHNEIYRFCTDASKLNSYVNKSLELDKLLEELEEKDTTNSFVDHDDRKSFIDKIEAKKGDVAKAEKAFDKIKNSTEDNSPIVRVLEHVENKQKKDKKNLEIKDCCDLQYRTKKLSRLHKSEQKFLGKIFKVIQDVLDSNTAENVIKRLEEEFK